MQNSPAAPPADPALFSVERGNPNPEELAALAAVVLCLQNDCAAGTEEPSARELVRRRVRRSRQMAFTPGAWRSGRS